MSYRDGRGRAALWRALPAVICAVTLAAANGRARADSPNAGSPERNSSALPEARAPEARAEPPRPAALGWLRAPGAESCIGARALAEAVEARLGGAALAPASRAEVSIEGAVAPATGEPGWRVWITVADGAGKVVGTRELSHAGVDCRAIDEEVSLTIALLIDPDAVLSLAAPSSGAKAPAPPAAAAPAATAKREPASACVEHPSPRVPAPWHAAFLAGPVVSFGALPAVGGGVQIRGLFTPPRFGSFQISGSVWAPATVSFGAEGASFFMAHGTLSACPLADIALGFRYAACAGVEVGAIRARGFGFPLAGEQERLLAGGVLEGRVVRRLKGPFALSVGFGIVVPFVRNRFYYLDRAGAEREVFVSSPVVGHLDLLAGFEL
jgi:hypothetical protein